VSKGNYNSNNSNPGSKYRKYLNHNDSFDRMHEKVTSSFERPNVMLNIKINTNQKTKDFMKDKIAMKVDKVQTNLNKSYLTLSALKK